MIYVKFNTFIQNIFICKKVICYYMEVFVFKKDDKLETIRPFRKADQTPIG